MSQTDIHQLQIEWGAGMFSYEVLKDNDVIVVTSTGKTTVEDYQTTAPGFFAEVESKRIRKALLDAGNSQGAASNDAKALSFIARQMSRSVFDKIALIFHDSIRNDMLECAELIRNAGKKVRSFSPQQHEAALEWLKDDQP